MASEKMKKVVSKLIHERNDIVAKKYVDKVNFGIDGWKMRYYKEKFHID